MKKLLFILLFFGYNYTLVDAQNLDKKGAIKTIDGFVIYVNNEAESFTIELKGNVELKNYPIIELNGNILQLITYPKSKFGHKTEQILTNYFLWEHRYHENELFKQKLQYTKKKIYHRNNQFQYWDFTNPIDPKIKIPVVKTCYLDYVHGETLFSFSFSSMDGNEKNAINILLGLFESTRFYDRGIDIGKLREEIINEKNIN